MFGFFGEEEERRGWGGYVFTGGFVNG